MATETEWLKNDNLLIQIKVHTYISTFQIVAEEIMIENQMRISTSYGQYHVSKKVLQYDKLQKKAIPPLSCSIIVCTTQRNPIIIC